MCNEKKQVLKTACLDHLKIIQTCRVDDFTYRLKPKSDTSAYALCFAIFGYHLLKQHDFISLHRNFWAQQIDTIEGRPPFGNLAMFSAVLLLFLQNYCGYESEAALKVWSQQHIHSMNRYGFWRGQG